MARASEADGVPLGTQVGNGAALIAAGDPTRGAAIMVAAIVASDDADLVDIGTRILIARLSEAGNEELLERSLRRIFRNPRWQADPRLWDQQTWLLVPAIERARVLVESEQYAAAAAVLEELASTFPAMPDTAEALRRAALCRALADDLPAAVRDIEALRRQWPDASVVTDPVTIIAPGTRFVCGKWAHYMIWWT